VYKKFCVNGKKKNTIDLTQLRQEGFEKIAIILDFRDVQFTP